MTRIRYKMNKFEVLVSPEFLAVDKVVYAEIFSNFSADIVEKSHGVARYVLKSNNMQNIKKLVKKTLIEMGVTFKNEVRPRFKDIQYTDLIKEHLGTNTSKTCKQDLFED